MNDAINRIGFTPAEFAAMNGRHQCWGYRQIYAGAVKVIEYNGRLLIPKSEIERFASKCGIYTPRKRRRTAEATQGHVIPKEKRLQGASHTLEPS